MKLNKKFTSLLVVLALVGGWAAQAQPWSAVGQLDFAAQKLRQSLATLKDTTRMPRHVVLGDSTWSTTKITDWTVGFFPGQLWLMYEATGQEEWKRQALRWSAALEQNQTVTWTHDLGFMLYAPLGNALRTSLDEAQKEHYKQVLLQTARSLATLYNPKVGTIKSWTWRKDLPHPTIIDNMLNLELLLWASKNGGGEHLRDIALSHARITAREHIRPDSTTYHLVDFDPQTGTVVKRVTDQGYSNSSMWARGQAWGIYGFAMMYRETREKEFLDIAKALAEAWVKRIPPDAVPYWDFMAPNIPKEPRDASAAAVAASGLIDLSRGLTNEGRVSEGKRFLTIALRTLRSLSKKPYTTLGSANPALILHGTGSKPHNSEVDVSLIYGDYYYLEALVRLKTGTWAKVPKRFVKTKGKSRKAVRRKKGGKRRRR